MSWSDCDYCLIRVDGFASVWFTGKEPLHMWNRFSICLARGSYCGENADSVHLGSTDQSPCSIGPGGDMAFRQRQY
jgi:hypothetical protein